MQIDKTTGELYEHTKEKFGVVIEKFNKARTTESSIICQRCGKLIGRKLKEKGNYYEIKRKNITDIESFASVYEDGD